MSTPFQLPPRPRAVNTALVLMVLSTLISVGNMVLFLPEMWAQMRAADPKIPPIPPGGIEMSTFLTLLLSGLLCRSVSKGSKMARGVWTVFAVMGMLNALSSVGPAFQMSPFWAMLGLALQGAIVASTVLLFVPSSAVWFQIIHEAKSSNGRKSSGL